MLNNQKGNILPLLFIIGLGLIFVVYFSIQTKRIPHQNNEKAITANIDNSTAPSLTPSLKNDCLWTPSIQIDTAGVEFMVTDKSGSQTGYDNQTNSIIINIEESIYGGAVGGGDTKDSEKREFFKPNNAAIQYFLTVVGKNPDDTLAVRSPFTMYFHSSDSCLNSVDYTYKDTISVGQTKKYIVDIEPGKSIMVHPQAAE